MGLVRVEIEGEKYELEENSFTMGEKYLLARDFGVDWENPEQFGYGGIVGMLVVALMRAGVPESLAKSRVLALKDEQVTITRESEDGEERPTGAVSDGRKKKTRAAAGKSGT